MGNNVAKGEEGNDKGKDTFDLSDGDGNFCEVSYEFL
jgi:hypothetical protein